MKRIFFAGYHQGAGGPREVNKNIIKHLPSSAMYIKSNTNWKRRVESVLKMLIADTVVYSGVFFRSWEIKLAHFLHKKIVYIMHGCLKYELNQYQKEEATVMMYADLVLGVSKTFSEIMKKDFYPEYKDKISYLYNGINWGELEDRQDVADNLRVHNRIILIGGGRIVKQNIVVCKAVKELNDEYNLDISIDLYGYYLQNDDSEKIKLFDNVYFHQVIPHKELLKEYRKARLFIQNSIYEPFSLGVVEALTSGCDLLLSTYVGAKDIIPGLTRNEIIDNPYDIEEVKHKIIWVFNNSNNRRLLKSIDRGKTSTEYATKRLIELCNSIWY